MDISRRLFLGSLIGGASLTVAGASLAMPSNRYQVLVEMQKLLYDTNKIARSFLTDPHSDVRIYYDYLGQPNGITSDVRIYYDYLGKPNGITDQLNALVKYMLAEFNHTDLSNPDVIKSVTETLFSGESTRINTMSEEELSRVEDAVVAITVFNHALHVEKVQFTTHEFGAFIKRYDMIRQPRGIYFWARNPVTA